MAFEKNFLRMEFCSESFSGNCFADKFYKTTHKCGLKVHVAAILTQFSTSNIHNIGR